MQSSLPIDDAMNSIRRSDLRPGFNTALFVETSHILQHQIFRDSPTLTRLLVWLLQETMAGRGDGLKSYTIAVEALGRPQSFDSQTDSYPRVQMGRLRKALEMYYSRKAPLKELCIYLQPGSYLLRFARLDLAYPQLYRPLSHDLVPAGREVIYPPAFARSRAVSFKKWRVVKRWISPLAFLVFILGLIMISLSAFL